MGFTITSLAGGLIGGILSVAGFGMILSPAQTRTERKRGGAGEGLFWGGIALSGVASLLFIPGVIMWPVGASMLND